MKRKFTLGAVLFGIAFALLNVRAGLTETTSVPPKSVTKGAKRSASLPGDTITYVPNNTARLNVTWSAIDPKYVPVGTIQLNQGQKTLSINQLSWQQWSPTAPVPPAPTASSRNLLFTPEDRAQTRTFYPLLTPETQGRLQVIPAPEPSLNPYRYSPLPTVNLPWKAAPNVAYGKKPAPKQKASPKPVAPKK